jgi:DNA ligase D-like protein (predicted 3'-phosphoesterase)
MADPHFVIQHHLATADHYDFRLEIDGVLVSWAVPKGPTLDPRERRLAKRVDDHSMDYELYEGLLSVQRRGGGPVLVWDRGTYRNVSNEKGRELTAAEALERGHLSFVLAGEKLQGGFSLVRTGDGDQWLLIKKRDGTADARRNLTSTQPESVLTGRTLDEIFEQESGL